MQIGFFCIFKQFPLRTLIKPNLMFDKLKFTLLILLVSLPAIAQVGIGTTAPTATLDIDGNLRIRNTVAETITEIAKDSVLLISRDGTVKTIPSKEVVRTALLSAVKGVFSSTGINTISLGAGLSSDTIPFDSEEFDLNDEYDTATHVFTAQQDGVYDVSVQINSSGGLAVATNYGVSILKNGTVVARENFANINISILTIDLNVTPPVRSAKTIVQLNAGDTISFEIFSNLLSVGLLGNAYDSFFTIVQIR